MELRKFLRSFLLGWPIWPVPKDFYQSIRLLGFALPWGVAAGSMMAVFAWWATWAWSWEIYNEIRASIAIGPYSLVEVLTGYLAFINDTWHFPLAVTDNIYPNGNFSIVWTDSIPIFSISC